MTISQHFDHILTQIVARSVTVSESESDWSESDFDGTRGKVESQLNVKRFLKVEEKTLKQIYWMQVRKNSKLNVKKSLKVKH